MARNINDRLAQLNTRRKGTDRLERVTAATQLELLQKRDLRESWERRAKQQPFTRYALGAMQEVSPDYTRIGLETADRVGKQLVSGLSTLVEFRLQGSVPLNVHVRGIRDVDLLTLDYTFRTYNTNGPASVRGHYTSSTARTSLGVLRSLRADVEKVLKDAFPKARVDCSGGKCIALSGGSLARPVDVVPAHWHDNITYQSSWQEHDRTVTIFNKKEQETIDNLPFLHIKRVHDRDTSVLGGLKKAIRLTKNVKNDAENEASASKLPSFDIAALLYHADLPALRKGHIYELAILQETQRFLDWCYYNKDVAKRLRTPDNSRVVLDTEAKFSALMTISVEMDALAKEVAKEQVASFRDIEPSWSQIDEALRNTYIPEAA